VIARCPQCQTRFRIPREKIGARGARVRCSRCSTVFKVQLPRDPPAVVAEPEPPATRPALARALVAEADAAVARGIAAVLESRRVEAQVVPTGAEALLALFRRRPDLAILGGHLPDIGARAIAEIARRSSELRTLLLIRIAPLHEPAGVPEFDADQRLEPGDLAAGLASLLERLRIGAAPAPAPAHPAVAPAPAVRPAAPPAGAAPGRGTTPAPVRESRAAGPVLNPLDPEVARAERLARITISDIVLYNEEKFARAAAQGGLAQAFQRELDEARQHFETRVPESLRRQRDFLVEELERRARQVVARRAAMPAAAAR
jgi:predicted Zn finger-like uncharacterized protein